MEIAPGNPAAVGVRFHVAQHCFLAHMDFRIGEGRAGIEDVGNMIRDCQFSGGQHAIIARRTAPTWPFVVVDCRFSGQREAAITTEEAGLALVRAYFSDMPRAIEVNAGRPEQLWLSDSLLERVTGPAITLADTGNALMQANLSNVGCRDVPVLLAMREKGDVTTGPGKTYIVHDLVHGWQADGLDAEPALRSTSRLEPCESLPALPPSDFPVLPAVATWANARALGAKGDGLADDTAALQEALRQHPAVFLPAGKYLVSSTLELGTGNFLIGLNPATTQLVVAKEARGFAGEGEPVPMIRTGKGGAPVLSGVGLDMGTAPRVTGIEWRGGERSLIDDVCFLSSHSSPGQRPGAELRAAWDTQGHSLWVHDGGGGTFANIWTANTTARSGLYVANTRTPGRGYVISAEHHLHREVRLQNVANWKFIGLQTEAEGDEGRECLQLEIDGCQDLLFANLFMYRVSRTVTPYRTAVESHGSHDIVFRGLHIYSPTKFAYDHAVMEPASGRFARDRDWAWLRIDRPRPTSATQALSAMAVKRVATGFESIDNLVPLPNGAVAFVDGRQGRIYEWRPGQGVCLRGESAVRPVALAGDPASGALFVISRPGQAYRWLGEVGAVDAVLAPLERLERADMAPGSTWLRPTSLFGPNNDFVATAQAPPRFAWRAGAMALPASDLVSSTGERPHPWIRDSLWRSYGVRPARAGTEFFASDEFRHKTYRFHVGTDGQLARPTLFAEVGEADVAVGADGKVYIAAGNLQVFDQAGKALGRIPIPERPQSLAWGGADGKTLLIAARSSLYALPR